jgi:hypothetical protein
MQKDKYVARFGESIFDVALLLYGSVECFSKILYDNQETVLNINQELEGLELSYDLGFKNLNVIPLTTALPVKINVLQAYKPTSFQTIFDVSLMTNGSLSDIIKLVHLSSLPNINTEIKISDSFPFTKKRSALLDWVESSGVVFQTKTPIEGNKTGEFSKDFDQLSFN